jgi:hypothetical protein
MDLYDSRVIEDAISRISKEVDTKTKALVSAPALDYAGYQRRVGEIKGLINAITEIEQVQKDFGRRQDDNTGAMQKSSTTNYED